MFLSVTEKETSNPGGEKKKLKELLRDATNTEAHHVLAMERQPPCGVRCGFGAIFSGGFAQSPPISVDSSRSVLSQEMKSRDASVS